MGNDLIGPCEVFGSEFERNLSVEGCISETSEQIQKVAADLWVVICGVPVLSNQKVRICVGAPRVESDLRRRWRRKT